MWRRVLAVAGVVELVVAGVAIARGGGDAKGVASVSATFSAAPTGTVDTRTCTSSAGKRIAVTHAAYAGVATGSPDLSGTVTIETQSTIDTSDGIGIVRGTLGIGASPSRAHARLTAVYDHGSLAGTLTGRAAKGVQLLGNVSSGFSAAGGFASGRIGTGAATAPAVELAAGSCARGARPALGR